MSDPCLEKIEENWDHITATFNAFQHKNPLIEFDVKSLKIFAYPAEEYLNGLSERTREEAKRQHRQAVSDGALQSWRMSHKIAAAGGGYAWPDLEFDSDGGSISVRSVRTPDSPREPVQYLRDLLEVVAADRFEQSIDEFLDGVLAGLASEGVNEQDLLRLWGEILEERRDPQRANWRKAEAILGAAGEEPAELMRRMEEAATEYGRRAMEEVAAHRMDEAPSHLSILASVESTDLPSVIVPAPPS